jgi:hypothetical protein
MHEKYVTLSRVFFFSLLSQVKYDFILKYRFRKELLITYTTGITEKDSRLTDFRSNDKRKLFTMT